MMIRGPIVVLRWVAPVALVSLTALLLLQSAGAQTRFTYSKGQSVSPAYEGWMPNEDGSFSMYFGYMNTNWLEEFDIPVGPANDIEPGGPDQGQPTHFYPRRSPFLFTVHVPKDFGTKELTWTITTHGKTERAYASLKSDYQIDNQVISTEVGGDFGSLRDELRTNVPPELKVQGEKKRSVTVGEPLSLVALAGDPDNLPARRDGRPQPRSAGGETPPMPASASGYGAAGSSGSAGASPASGSGATGPAPGGSGRAGGGGAAASNPAALIYRPPTSLVPSSGPGLRLSWIVYRG